MCGRYASARKRQELLEEFQVNSEHADAELPPDYNVAPTKRVYAVLTRTGRAGDGEDAGGPAVRQLRVLRWGLVPPWAKDPAIGSRLINARAETVAVKPSFRRAFARRRCLLPADGYYEWQAAGPEAGRGRARKVPYYIHRSDGGVLAFAGLYELWRRPPGGPGAAAAVEERGGLDSWLWTVTIITTRAVDELGHVHDRMPMVIDRSRWDDWLDPFRTGGEELRELMVPAAAGGLDVYPVSPAVGNVRNNGRGLIERAGTGAIPPETGTAVTPGSPL